MVTSTNCAVTNNYTLCFLLVLAIELLAACQALDFHHCDLDKKPDPPKRLETTECLEEVYKLVRSKVE